MNNNKSNQELKIGDTVELKSGGPPMIITKYDKCDDIGYFTCQWFAGEKLEEDLFTPGSLQLVVVKPRKKGTAKSKSNL